ncbi:MULTISPECIES: STAS domain-containing protein [unclassified Amycolatopsis]|uniref:STAS domain-containing protein n=1 Tax=unclassified Amycolatopsis TaxID=2618356 RepID=UPI001C69DF21|nr:STAS domain-containing protein [Amycolatopsis sp. DSM 110486]QYN19124.1 STAS domain-containing protein [Amycolatopsis sp. DSM 110486]
MPASDPERARGAGETGVSLRREGSAVVLTARGEFDALTTPQLQAAVREALHDQDPPDVLVIDLTAVNFFASMALAALAEARQAAGERTTLRLAVEHSLDRTLRLIGLDQRFALYSSATEALAAEKT